MSTDKRLPLAVLATAAAALAGTIAWAVTKATDDGGYPSSGPVMMQSATGQGMMGYAPEKRRQVGGLLDAKRLAQRFADDLDLEADEVLRFERNYYVKLVDRQGRGATEVLVDPETGFVSLEYGPAMMWNTRYGMMGGNMMGSYGQMMGAMMGGGMMGGGSGSGMMGSGSFSAYASDGRDSGMMGGGSGSGMMGGGSGSGMMGGGSGSGMMGGGSGSGMMGGGSSVPDTQRSSSVRISPEQAERLAERWLRANDLDVEVSEAEAFPGYYTLETVRSGRIDGMLSVHATTGAVIYHWWHGGFLEMLE